jgi:cystathionine beta-lyase
MQAGRLASTLARPASPSFAPDRQQAGTGETPVPRSAARFSTARCRAAGMRLRESAKTNPMDSTKQAGFSTLIQHFGEDVKPYGAVVPPIFHNSLFTFEDSDAFEAAMGTQGRVEPFVYSRVGNPTVAIAEAKIAKLEGAEAAKVVAGGAAALSATVLTALQDGSHIVMSETAYGTSRGIAESVVGRYGASVTNVDGSRTEEVLDAIRPDTSLIVMESPGGIVFNLQDIEAITNVAREKKVLTMFDNTYSTPLFQNPLSMGVDVVVHSCSKYLGGHSDIIGGAVCSTEAFVRRVSDLVGNVGSVLSPFPAWLLIRGMRTLDVRLKRHEETANRVARWLESRREVELVRHVSLESFPQRDLFLKQMRGSSGLLSFEPARQDRDRLKRFIDALSIFQRGISWGGFESLALLCKMKLSHWPEERFVIRIHCGLEDVEDLIADLEQAMAAAEL